MERLRKRLGGAGAGSGEDGFTILEVLIAAFILVLGALAVFMSFAAAIHNVQRGRETQIGVSAAQREMELVRAMPYDQVALSSQPLFSAETKSPDNRLTQSGTKFNVNRGAEEEALEFPVLWQVGVGKVAPETRGLRSVDGTEVTVYRFVLCEEPGGTVETCLRKRVVIDVLPTPKGNLGNYQHSYYELQSTVVDPEAA